jgi:hypothetical protein
MERITVIIDKGENVIKEQKTLLFLEHKGLYILYVITDGAIPEHCIGRTNFEDIVTFAQNYLKGIGEYEVFEPKGFDAETMKIYEKLRA